MQGSQHYRPARPLSLLRFVHTRCVALLIAATAAVAQAEVGDAWSQNAHAPAQAVSVSSLDALRMRLESMTEHEVKSFYARCSQESIERRLDGGEAMACSIGYDVLLRKHFGGDFAQLFAWSRSLRAVAN